MAGLLSPKGRFELLLCLATFALLPTKTVSISVLRSSRNSFILHANWNVILCQNNDHSLIFAWNNGALFLLLYKCNLSLSPLIWHVWPAREGTNSTSSCHPQYYLVWTDRLAAYEEVWLCFICWHLSFWQFWRFWGFKTTSQDAFSTE